MAKFAQQKKNKVVELPAVAYAVTSKIAGQFESVRFRSECARDTMYLSYRQLNNRARQDADTIASDILSRMSDMANTKDLRCEVDAHFYRGESISVAYRTGFEDYGFRMTSDGNWTFKRIRAA